MIEVYSLDKTVAANAAITWDDVWIEKGITSTLTAPASIDLNVAGVYCVSCSATSASSASIELFVDGNAVPATERTGFSPSFEHLVTVSRNNTSCCCSRPVTIQIRNSGADSASFDAVNLVVTKLC